MISNVRRALALCALAIASAAVLRAEDLVGNGEFDVDIADWEYAGTFATLQWNAVDHDGCGAASGSALATNTGTIPDLGVYFTTCVTGIEPGRSYSFESHLRFPTGQAATGYGVMLLQWYDATLDCSGAFVGNSQNGQPVVTTATPGVWVRTGLDSTTAPAGAYGVRARITLVKETVNENLMLRFDGVRVVDQTGLVLADGVEIGTTCRWSSTVP